VKQIYSPPKDICFFHTLSRVQGNFLEALTRSCRTPGITLTGWGDFDAVNSSLAPAMVANRFTAVHMIGAKLSPYERDIARRFRNCLPSWTGLSYNRIIIDGVSVARLIEEAGQPIAPEGLSFNDRYFVLVARLVPKKDVATAIAAYARYRETAGDQARQFHICRLGALGGELRALVDRLNLDGVVFHGFVQRRDVARTLSGGVALILTSVREQWGLVINEALAFGLPILATDNVGARDLLLRTAVSGYVFEPGNVEGLAQLIFAVARDETERRRLVSGAHTLGMEGDTGRFVDGVLSLIEPGLAVPRVVPDLVEAVIDERYE
jgi:glycosyltransferase involved in cell wall biosynthesis